MFDIGSPELLLVAVVAIVVIGPKDLPKAMRFVGYWVGRARSVMGHVRSGFDAMVREAELEEMEKRWASENERIMREHPTDDAQMLPAPEPATVEETEPDPSPEKTVVEGDRAPSPVMVEKPEVSAAPAKSKTRTRYKGATPEPRVDDPEPKAQS